MYLYNNVYKELLDKINHLYSMIKDKETPFKDDLNIDLKLKVYHKAITYLNDLDSNYDIEVKDDLDFKKLNSIKPLKQQIKQGEYQYLHELKNELTQQNELWFKLWYINYALSDNEFDIKEINKQSFYYENNKEIIGSLNQNFIKLEWDAYIDDYDLLNTNVNARNMFHIESLKNIPMLEGITSEHFLSLIKHYLYDSDLDLKKEFKRIDQELTNSNEL